MFIHKLRALLYFVNNNKYIVMDFFPYYVILQIVNKILFLVDQKFIEQFCIAI